MAVNIRLKYRMTLKGLVGSSFAFPLALRYNPSPGKVVQ